MEVWGDSHTMGLRGKLRQSRLSFKKTNPLEDNPDVQDETFLDDNTGNKFELKGTRNTVGWNKS